METVLREVCQVLTAMWRKQGSPYLFGARPTNADFALFGQLRQCAVDPFPSRVMHEFPCAWSWVWQMDDLSGIEPPSDDATHGALPPPAVMALLNLAARTHLPLLQANAHAVSSGEEEVTVDILPTDHGSGATVHRQPPFRYQATYCWPKLQMQYAQLHGTEREYVNAALDKSGCARFFNSTSTGTSTGPVKSKLSKL